MPKRIPYTYKLVLRNLLKEARLNKGFTQVQLAKRLGRPQNYVSKYESGEKRLDVLELREICQALETALPGFVRRLEVALSKEAR